jgi:hypothetical protein
MLHIMLPTGRSTGCEPKAGTSTAGTAGDGRVLLAMLTRV